MSRWEKSKVNNRIRDIPNEEVRSYIEYGMDVMTYDAYDPSQSDSFRKTFVIRCGMCDGENIDLFDLQKWFDDNREWIDSLREEVQGK